MPLVASEETAARLTEIIQAATPVVPGIRPSAVADEVEVVEATGANVGKLVYYTGSAWADRTGSSTVTLLGLSGGSFTTGKRYTAIPFGTDTSNSRGRYLVTGGTGGVDPTDATQENQPGGWKYQTVVTAVGPLSASCDSSGNVTFTCPVTTASVKVLV